MEIDKTTLDDLSIFTQEESFSVLHKIDYTLTSNGKEQLKAALSTPLKDIHQIQGVQQTLLHITDKIDQWPTQISNGTIKVLEKLYESAIDPIPPNINSFNAASYRLLHKSDFLLVQYSMTHCFDFLKGNSDLVSLLLKDDCPTPLKELLLEIKSIINQETLSIVYKKEKSSTLSVTESLQLGHFILYRFKYNMSRLIQIHAKIDAWFGMAVAVKKLNLHFPSFIESTEPFIEAEGLYHILLDHPVDYDVCLNRETNFLFLTGANMAGKSTFIKSVGAAVFLAHTGMGIPAKKMTLCVFDGMLSNINVADNIIKGESYFFNEVQRIKSTIYKINDGRKWLILIDELFKGTNMQDAMKCSSLVIEGFLKISNSIFILSTHLYEIGEALKIHSTIQFNYFETGVLDDQLNFSYRLKEGISNDRLGYLILKNEGVVQLLEDL